jgi:hypothetical protein
MRTKIEATDGPFGDVIAELRRLAAAGRPLASLLELAKVRIADEYAVYSATHAFMQAFDMSLETAELLESWSGWRPGSTGVSAEELARMLPPLVPRGPDTPMADLGPGCAIMLRDFLASSPEPFWVGIRRELDSRGLRPSIALAEGWRPADEAFTFVALIGPQVVEFTYEWPDGHPDAGTITTWEDATEAPLAHEFQHALRHARDVHQRAEPVHAASSLDGPGGGPPDGAG